MPHLRHRILVASVTFCFAMVIHIVTPPPGAADDFDLTGLLQDQFEALSEEAGLAISYAPAAPAEPLGFPHFDVGAEATITKIDSDALYWQAAFNGDPPSYLPVPKLRARVGLPFGVDVGAIYSTIPYIKVNVIGGEIKWAVFKGGIVMPAIALRGAYTTVLNVNEIDLDVYSADLSISKGFLIFTPYAGVGQVWIKAEEETGTLEPERHSKTRGFVGLQIGVPLIRFAAEAAFSSVQSYTARLSVGF